LVRDPPAPGTMSEICTVLVGCGRTAPSPSLGLLSVATAMASSLRLGAGAVARATRGIILVQGFLMPESEIGDQLTVPLDIRPLQVLEKATPPADHLEQASAAVVILLVSIEVGPEIVDAGREDGDLDRSAPTIAIVELVLLDDVFFCYRHVRRCLRESRSLQGKRIRMSAEADMLSAW